MADDTPATCQAIVAKGPRKGQVCGQPATQGKGVCGYHSAERRAKMRAAGTKGGGRPKKNHKTSAVNVAENLAAVESTFHDYQDVIDHCGKYAALAAQGHATPNYKEQIAWLRMVMEAMATRDRLDMDRQRLHFDSPPVTIVFEGLADAPPADFPPPPPGASDDPISGVIPLSVRQGA